MNITVGWKSRCEKPSGGAKSTGVILSSENLRRHVQGNINERKEKRKIKNQIRGGRIMSCINIESHLWMDDEARPKTPSPSSPFSSEPLTNEPTGYSGSITLSKANHGRFEKFQYIHFDIPKTDTDKNVIDAEVEILKDIISGCQSMIRKLLGEEYQRVRELLDIPIEELPFRSNGKRIKRLLLMNDIRTLADLVQCRRADLRQIKYFGGRCVTEVMDTLEELGLSFGMDISEYK